MKNGIERNSEKEQKEMNYTRKKGNLLVEQVQIINERKISNVCI